MKKIFLFTLMICFVFVLSACSVEKEEKKEEEIEESDEEKEKDESKKEEKEKDEKEEEKEESEKALIEDEKKEAKTLVVYYSLSKNTEIMAQEIAKNLKADIIIIEASAYSPEGEGLKKAHADGKADVKITDIVPETKNMDQYDSVFLGAPIWWYRPAVPLWTFVEKNDFTDKKVVLFTTYGSSFHEKDIEEFGKLIENKGGTYVEHLGIAMGESKKKSNKEVLEATRKLIQKYIVSEK